MNRHDDFRQVTFDVLPCDESVRGCKAANPDVLKKELAKLDLVLIFNNEKFDATASAQDMIVNESIVKHYPIVVNQKSMLSSVITETRVEEKTSLLTVDAKDLFEFSAAS